MRIIVVGCGKIGTTIVETFITEGHEVVALDNDPAAVAEIGNVYDAITVCGNGVDSDTLEEAGVEKTELFVAVTGSDEMNMLSCFLARRMGAKHTIARIRNPEYNDQSLSFMKQQLSLSMAINPESLAAKELFNILKVPSAVTVETFSRRNFEMVELVLREGSSFAGLSLIELRKKFPVKFLVCVVQREDKVYVPDGSFVLQVGDRIGISATSADIQKLMRLTGMMQKQAKSVMILGASRMAYYLAKMLLDSGTSVKIIDMDHTRCEEISNLLPSAIVIQGDGVQQELLLEEGIETVDAFVALTGMDEENILVSIFASTHNVPKVIAKVNRGELASMAERLGLDCVISPKKFVADVVTRYGRALQNSLGSKVETLYRLMDGKAETLEFCVQTDFKGLDIPLRDLKLKPNTLVAGIIRGRKALLPTGDDSIQVGDNVVVLAAGKQLQDLSDILL